MTTKTTQRRTTHRVALALTPLALVAAVAVALLARPDDPFDGHAITDPPFPPLTYALHTSLWWDENEAGKHLDWVRMLGYNTVKQKFPWTDMEPEPGTWDFSAADRIVQQVADRDLHLVVRLGQTPDWAAVEPGTATAVIDTPPADLDAWANYCGTVAARYRGQIRAYQIWNEPNLAREWGALPPDPVSYVELLAACSQAIRTADPAAVLISSGLSPTGNTDALALRDDLYLQAMYDADFQQYIDVVGAHAPGFGPPSYGPDDAEHDGSGRWFSFRRIEDLRKIMLANDDAARQMAILEFGWTTDTRNPDYAWFAVSEAQQAEYIVAAYEYALRHWTPWVGLTTLIYLPDPNWTEADEQSWWALVDPDGKLRPAFFAIAGMSKTCGDTILPERPPDHPEFSGDEPPRTCP